MPNPKKAPYGSWASPITSAFIVADSIWFGNDFMIGQDIYWMEGRPSEGGRGVIVRRTGDGHLYDVNPSPLNVRTRVHEYGGGAFLIDGQTVYFSNFEDQRLYRAVPGELPVPVTPESPWRYADGVMDSRRRRILCVREEHATGKEAVNTIVGVALDGDTQIVLVAGNDFYASPRLSPCGKYLLWLTWNHPNMPWDGTELWLADVQPDGSLSGARCIAGGENESIFQPEWSPDGVIYFVSDRDGWWNLYRWNDGCAEPVVVMEAEFGLPQWVFGLRTYAFESEERIICTYIQNGRSHLACLNPCTGALTRLVTPYTDIAQVAATPGKVLFQGSSPTLPRALVLLDPATGQHQVLRREKQSDIAPGYLSLAQAIEFPTGGDLTAYALFYPPRNQDYVAPDGEKPPLLVMSHGGPTGGAQSALDLGIQYWTSRGFAVLDVNYGGSTGYGRAYRERLRGQWGIVDVEDCVNGALHLVAQGLVDGNRLIIRGGSAGGYTTLCALTFHDAFKAGASHFGIGDLEILARETHKFESRYLDRLVGSYPECRDVYRARSPINHVDLLNCPVIFFQGLDDRVVAPIQSETMATALQKKGIPVAYLAFEGEQHGFRHAANIQRALDAELYFYSRIFGFALADKIEAVHIENLKS
ncbi:MAG: S9 family peptidase [Anaerolineae bacterium]|nr:S9 family peptidase [Anaerolineae bacterium]